MFLLALARWWREEMMRGRWEVDIVNSLRTNDSYFKQHEEQLCGNTTAVQFLRSLTVLDLTESRDYKHSPKSKKNKRRLLITSIFSLDVCVEETKIFT